MGGVFVERPDYRLPTDDRQSTMGKCLWSVVSVSAPNVIIETIQHAGDGNGIIIRLYEIQRKRGLVKIQMGFAVESARETIPN